MPLCMLGRRRWCLVALAVFAFQPTNGTKSDESHELQSLSDSRVKEGYLPEVEEKPREERTNTNEKGEHEEGEEEEEEASPEAIAIAGTLMCLIVFQMLLFYMINHRDADMRRYTYEAFSSTISIFSAVLVFQSFNGLLNLAIEDWSVLSKCVALLLHKWLWFGVLQVVLAHISGAIGELTGRKPDLARAEYADNLKGDMACFAVLLAHMTGFASIAFWGTLQQLPVFSSSPGMSLLVVPPAMLAQFCLQQVSNWIRKKIALSDDGAWDATEEIWDEYAQESEDDVVGLCVSWLLVQALRFWITGKLPNVTGSEEWDETVRHSFRDIGTMWITGVFFAVVVAIVTFLRFNKNEETRGRMARCIDCIVLTMGMAYAWCVFFASEMLVGTLPLIQAGGQQNRMVLAVSVTMFVSFGSSLVILLLDKLADSECTGEAADKGIIRVIGAVGIAIGFGWEQSFDHATEALSESMPIASVSKVLMGIAIAAVVIPAWRWYILPMSVMEGWKFGFVIDFQRRDLWKEIVEHEKFAQASQAVMARAVAGSTEEEWREKNAVLESKLNSLLDAYHRSKDPVRRDGSE